MARPERSWRPLGAWVISCVALGCQSGGDPGPWTALDEHEGGAALHQDEHWFVNLSDQVGLGDARGKDCVFFDLEGDGDLDLCLDRHRIYRNEGLGRRFVRVEDCGLEFPILRRPALDREGARSDESRVRALPYVPHYLYFADVNNDGLADALYGVYADWIVNRGGGFEEVEACDPGERSRVYLNRGGYFERAEASEYSHPEAVGPVMSLAMCDVDRDGCLDLFEGRQYTVYGVLSGCGVDRMWMGDGSGGFVDGTEAAGLMTTEAPGGAKSSRPTFGTTHADVDGDDWPDLLQLAYGRQWNYLWLNDGAGRFGDVGPSSGFAGDEITHGRYPESIGRSPERPFRSNGNTFDCAVGDIDNDGDLDLFLGEITHAWAGEASDLPSLLINVTDENGVRFERKTVREFLPERPSRGGANWNFGDLHAAFVDVDLDTRLDLLIGSGDYPDGQFLRLYRQTEDGGFEERTELANFDWEGCGSLSLGDYDRDGDVDILAGRSFMRLNQAHRDQHMGGLRRNIVGLFRNDIGNQSGHHWCTVQLRGAGAGKSNGMGLGARVLVTAGGVTQTRELRGGAGLSNHQDPPEVHFGLGKATEIERLEVRWPNGEGTIQTFDGLPADRHILVREGAEAPELRSAPGSELASESAPGADSTATDR